MPGEGARGASASARCSSACASDDGALRYAGRVGTGFTEAELDRLAALLGPLRARRLAVRARAGRSRRAARSGSSRELVAEVEFREWTAAAACCARPSYKGAARRQAGRRSVRAPSATAAREPRRRAASVDGRELKLSNLDKVLYPEAGFTKRDVIDYYAAHRAGAAAAPRAAAR